MPHTPKYQPEKTHNLIGLNEKLIALSQKLQAEPLEEVGVVTDLEEASSAPAGIGSGQTSKQIPVTVPPITAVVSPGVVTSMSSPIATAVVTALPQASQIPAAHTSVGVPSASLTAGVLQVDTLNGLANALQKVCK